MLSPEKMVLQQGCMRIACVTISCHSSTIVATTQRPPFSLICWPILNLMGNAISHLQTVVHSLHAWMNFIQSGRNQGCATKYLCRIGNQESGDEWEARKHSPRPRVGYVVLGCGVHLVLGLSPVTQPRHGSYSSEAHDTPQQKETYRLIRNANDKVMVF